ncbi:hypothetical protein [Brucella intermedia]|uniref:hypothetical protein n=1 Tax=Brucella intermedia TaxID=94625 RepID=UPI00224B06E9|nr:hypothetical protein [Brucella intermedia]
MTTTHPSNLTHLQCEAALCIWEAMLENVVRQSPQLKRAFETYGTVEMRHCAIRLAPLACKVWDLMTEDERENLIPYDWEFIPKFVRTVPLEVIGYGLDTNYTAGEIRDLMLCHK